MRVKPLSDVDSAIKIFSKIKALFPEIALLPMGGQNKRVETLAAVSNIANHERGTHFINAGGITQSKGERNQHALRIRQKNIDFAGSDTTGSAGKTESGNDQNSDGDGATEGAEVVSGVVKATPGVPSGPAEALLGTWPPSTAEPKIKDAQPYAYPEISMLDSASKRPGDPGAAAARFVLASQAARPSLSRIDALERQAMAEEPGKRTVGHADYGFSTTDTLRMATDAYYREKLQAEAEKEWIGTAEKIMRDALQAKGGFTYDQLKEELIIKGNRGDMLSPVQTKLAQMVSHREVCHMET